MHWYLVHTKPRQEKYALENLEQRGYQCYLPTLASEKSRQSPLAVLDEPLFPRYLFIRLGQGESAKDWGVIRSTNGVSRLVAYGAEPVKIDDGLIKLLRMKEASDQKVQGLVSPEERGGLAEAAFAEFENIYQMADGEHRVMVLIEILSKPAAAPMSPAGLRKAG